MNPKEAQQLFNHDFQKALKATPFPNEYLPLPLRLHHIKHVAMQTESPITAGFPFAELKVFLMKADGYTLFEAAQLFNIIERKTPRDMNNNPDYYSIQEEVYKATVKWQELVAPIREAVDRKISLMVNSVKGINGKNGMKIIQ